MTQPTANPSVTATTEGQTLTLTPATKLMDDDVLRALMQAVDAHAPDSSGVTRIVLDLAAVRLIPSLALGLLVQLNTRSRARGRKLALANVTPQVRQVFAITRLDRAFDFTTPAPDAPPPP